MKKLIYLFSLSILWVSCHQQKYADENLMLADMALEEEMMPITRMAENEPPPPIKKLETQAVVKQKIIKDGKMSIEVDNLEGSKAQVDSLLNKYGAYYASERLNNTNWETSYVLTIRVPGKYFEHLIASIEKGSGKIFLKEIDARDVTDQFIDLETRLTNKKSYLKKYQELLKRAKTVKEILEIEEKIRGIEEEIESTTGRLKYLNDQVTYSTLNLNISKPIPEEYQAPTRAKFMERIKNALTKGWFGLVDFLVFCVNIWPFWIIICLIIYLWGKYKRKRREKNKHTH